MTNATELRRLGRSELLVTGICIGASPIGSAPALYGHETTHDDAVATVLATFDGPFNFLDTSNNYGGGESERRIGAALQETGMPAGFVLASKVDGDSERMVFDGARVRQSLEESLERLGLDSLPLVYLHDTEYYFGVDEALADGGPALTLAALKAEGLIGATGIAIGPVSQTARFIETGLFDVMLTHNRYSLVDRSADAVMDRARELDLGVVNAAPFGGGLLAKGPSAGLAYAYGSGSAAHLAAATAMHEACERAGVPLAAAAVQFSVRDARIHSTVLGASKPSRIAETVALLEVEIPDSLWQELESLTPGPEHWFND